MRVCDTRDLAAAARAPLARLGVMPALMRTFGIATTPGGHRWALRGIWIGPRRCHDGGGSSEPLAHVGEGVEVLVGGPARSHYDPVVYRSTRAPNVPNAVSAWMATTRHLGGFARSSTRRRSRAGFADQGRRGGGHGTISPDGVSWSCSNRATIFTRTP